MINRMFCRKEPPLGGDDLQIDAPKGRRDGATGQPAIPESRVIAIVCILLAAATLFAYWQVQSFTFILFDDPLYVTENKIVRDGVTARGVSWAFSSFSAANWHPLTWISHMVDVDLYRFNPAGHHWTSVIIHVINTILLFCVLQAMTRCVWPSAFVSALFGLHPLHVESVAWIAERKDVLSAFFWFAAMGAYLRYTKEPSLRRYGLVVVLFALGLLSKPMVVTLPLVLLLLDYWPLERHVATKTVLDPFWTARGRKTSPAFARLAAEKIPLLLLSAVSCVTALLAQKQGGAFVTFESLPIGLRLVNALDSYFRYLLKTLVPADLAFFYPMSREILVWQVAGLAVLFLLLMALVVVAAKRYPYLLVGWLWYLGTLVPVIGIVQVGMQSMADRYTYIPLTGIFIMAAWGMKSIAEAIPRSRAMLAAIAIALIPVLVMLTRNQALVWKDSVTLFTRALVVTEKNHIAHNNLAAIHLEAGRLDIAVPHLRKALEIYPLYAQAHGNMGAALFMQRKYDEAIRHVTTAMKIDPTNPNYQVQLAAILAASGRDEEANQLLVAILRQDPHRDDALLEMGMICLRAGRTGEALTHLAKAAWVNPAHIAIRYQYGIALAKAGRHAEAAVQFKAALMIRPDDAEIRTALEDALLRARVGREGESMKG